MSSPKTAPGSTDSARESYCIGRGTADGDHCCYVDGETCRYLADNGPDAERRYECSLRRDLGSWKAVHADPGYIKYVQPSWEGTPIESCGSWQPSPGDCCREPRITETEVEIN